MEDDEGSQTSETAAPAGAGRATVPLARIDAVVFDMDGVVTDTAIVHAAAWKRLFDQYLEECARRTGQPQAPFDQDSDYRRYVDGKPRYDGVRSFLQSRGITIPEGDSSDPPDRETVCGLGNRKDQYFLEELRRGGARAFPSTVELVRELTEAGVRTSVVSASRNMDLVLESAGVAGLFSVRVSGVDADELGLPGKPDPAIFLEAARRLGTDPARTAVVEDALAGVEAGRRGGFGLVVGIDRTGQGRALIEAGADVVVSDLAELRLEGAADRERAIRELPPALAHREEIADRTRSKRVAVFLDYDGTLTPIVDDPADALLPPATREALERLAATRPVAVISGRDLNDVRAMVGLPGIWYAGSHGFDIAGPNGERHQNAADLLPALDQAEAELRAGVAGIPGARVERKRFAIAVHYRQVDESHVLEIEAVVDRTAAVHPELRKTGGKKVFELRPGIPWDKGKALGFLLETLGLDGEDVVPTYIGDDETDEDAFRAVGDRGLAFVVRGEDDERPTVAHYSLADTAEVAALLATLAESAEGAAWTPGP
ncbi:MAG TPA: trehalose-phosphatase [Actinomycetota bacterium]